MCAYEYREKTFTKILLTGFDYILFPYIHQTGNESPSVSMSGQDMDGGLLPNEISAPYEVAQYPIEQIETKLQIQRHLNVK